MSSLQRRPLRCASLTVLTSRSIAGAWSFHPCVCGREDFSWTTEIEKASFLSLRHRWEVLFCTVRSFKTLENCFFQCVILRMFQELFYFLGDFVRENLYNVRLWCNSSIGKGGFELVEPYYWSVCVERWNTKSSGVLVTRSSFRLPYLMYYYTWKTPHHQYKSSTTCTGDKECVFKSGVELLLLCLLKTLVEEAK